MNLAILIGVSEYGKSLTNLPACKNDVNVIYELLTSSGKYTDILILNEDTTSQLAKERLTEFVKNHSISNHPISEIFFYFSGHGVFKDEEFYYILSDYEDSWHHKTSLSNNEIDDLLKTLNADLTIKVVDACQSGARYIKDTDESQFNKMLNGTKATFNNCYFLFSSQSTQSSFASDKISFFTKSLIDSIISHKTKQIRYKDIIDFINDDFKQQEISQTPFYVTQCNFTEIFCEITEQLQKNIQVKLGSFDIKKTHEDLDNEKKLSIIDLIKQDSERYISSMHEVFTLFENNKKIIDEYQFSHELNELFDFEVLFETIRYNNVTKISSIAQFLSETKENLFINIKRVKEKIENRLPINFLSRTEYQEVIESYELTEDTPYNRILIIAKPRFPNLPRFTCNVIFAFSKTNFYFLYYLVRNEEVSFNKYKIAPNQVKWRHSVTTIKSPEKVEQSAKNIISEYDKFILKFVSDNFPIDA